MTTLARHRCTTYSNIQINNLWRHVYAIILVPRVTNSNGFDSKTENLYHTTSVWIPYLITISDLFLGGMETAEPVNKDKPSSDCAIEDWSFCRSIVHVGMHINLWICRHIIPYRWIRMWAHVTIILKSMTKKSKKEQKGNRRYHCNWCIDI